MIRRDRVDQTPCEPPRFVELDGARANAIDESRHAFDPRGRKGGGNTTGVVMAGNRSAVRSGYPSQGAPMGQEEQNEPPLVHEGPSRLAGRCPTAECLMTAQLRPSGQIDGMRPSAL